MKIKKIFQNIFKKTFQFLFKFLYGKIIINQNQQKINYNQKKISILNSQSNIYHYSDEGICSWYELAKSIFLFSKISCKIKPIQTKDYPFNIMRPHYSVMNTEKIKKNIPKLKVPKWPESLKNCLKEIKKQSSVYSEI